MRKIALTLCALLVFIVGCASNNELNEPTLQEPSQETPQETSLETSTEASLETPPEISLETAPETSLDTPLEASLETPPETSQETPQDELLEAPPETSLETPEETPTTTNPLTEQAPHPLTADEGTEELLALYTALIEFNDPSIDESHADMLPTVFATTVTITNFKFIEVGFSNDLENFYLYDAGTLYSLDYLTLETPFVVYGLPWSSIPQRGVSFVDENGDTRSFAVSISGYDGSIVIGEIYNSPN